MAESERSRRLVLIDGRKLYYLQRDVQAWFDFRRLREVLAEGCESVDIRYYTPAVEQAESFNAFLKSIGYSVVLTADPVEAISEDVCAMVDQVEIVTVVVNDVGCIDALGLAKHRGVKVELYGLETSLPPTLRELADVVVSFRDIRERIIDEAKTRSKPFSRSKPADTDPVVAAAEAVPLPVQQSAQLLAKLFAHGREMTVEQSDDEVVIRIRMK